MHLCGFLRCICDYKKKDRNKLVKELCIRPLYAALFPILLDARSTLFFLLAGSEPHFIFIPLRGSVQ